MTTLFKIIFESIAQATGQLTGNKLRTFLSLLGISIGIFCIIGVDAAGGPLERKVSGRLQKLGDDIVYVKKWTWTDVSGSWWDYIKRPNPDHGEFEVLSERMNTTQLTSFHVAIGFRTLKWKSNSAENNVLIGASQNFIKMFAVEFAKGRYFSPSEYRSGANKVVIGYKVAENLFGEVEAVGKTVKMAGQKYEIIGVIAKAGKDLINPLDFDDCIVVSYTSASRLVNLKATQVFDTSITLKAKEGIPLQVMKDEATGILRSERRLRPKEKDSFSLNELSMISSFFDGFFSVLNTIGFVIGIFAILVGGFSVANIMFVSVKERTNIIGIKKALGAKKYIILLEFLIESVILCIIGGLVGLALVFGVLQILTNALDFELFLSSANVLYGLIWSVAIGMVAGLIPAFQAASMDPVEAMRQ
ncbi:MAG: ABC transporter permease [Saprospiraceae bacterium]